MSKISKKLKLRGLSKKKSEFFALIFPLPTIFHQKLKFVFIMVSNKEHFVTILLARYLTTNPLSEVKLGFLSKVSILANFRKIVKHCTKLIK